MRNKIFLLSFIIICTAMPASAWPFSTKDARKKEAEYIHKVLKEEEKEKYERKDLDYDPSGFMTQDAYEELSGYRDKSEDKIEIPKVNNSDMKYVPQPTYKIVRYNDPPGSPELNINKSFYKLHQYNGQGITAPDFSKMVYPVVYYYPNSESTASDLFVIPLENKGTHLDRILKANAKKRNANPILSTEKSIDNNTAFRTLTPIDFSADSSKILVKEKIGSSHDGIWQTNAIVYDFQTKTSYNLVELRDAIIYYWKEHKGLDLEEYRWDIYPLGFLKNSNSRVAAFAYAFTGDKPIFLGIWSVDTKGQQSRLMTFKLNEVQFSINGFKIIQDGVVKRTIVETEEKAVKKAEKADMKKAKKNRKNVSKKFREEYEEKIKIMDKDFKDLSKEYDMLNKLEGSTSLNEIPVEYKELKIEYLEKIIKKEEKKLNKEIKKLDKIYEKLDIDTNKDNSTNSL